MMIIMASIETGKPVCSRCHAEHSDRRKNYCAACAETVRVEFGTSHSLRVNTQGDPNRPVRRVVTA